MNLAVIIAAAGFSGRYAAAQRAEEGVDLARSKLEEDLGGRSVLLRSVELFTQGQHALAEATSLVVVAGPNDPEAFERFKARFGDALSLYGCVVVRGGVRHRYETVLAGLRAIPPAGGHTHIAVHDAARPCTPTEVMERLASEASRHVAVVPAVEVADTLKRVEEVEEQAEVDAVSAILGGESGATRRARLVRETVDRSGLVAVQTPQVFEAGLLRRAYAQADLSSTDDSQLVERVLSAEGGGRVRVVEGDVRNVKITRPHDLRLARAILGIGAGDGKSTSRRF